jgi:hypothetical protein
MGLEYPRTELTQVGMDFAPAETADAAAEIVGEEAEVETAEVAADMDFVAADMDFVAAEMDLPEMDLLELVEESAPSVTSSGSSRSSGYSDSAIQTGC